MKRSNAFLTADLHFSGYLLASVSIYLFLGSCNTIKVIKKMHSESAAVNSWSNREKELVFLPMHHVGKPEFYEDIREQVISLKKQGFRVYFEAASMEPGLDSLSIDTYERKFRRMIGVHVDSTGYATLLHEKGVFKNMISQPKYSYLGLDSNDVRVDIHKNELIDAYETRYGTIQLQQIDHAIPLKSGQTIPSSLKLPKDNVFSIIMDHRNEHLAEYIQKSADKKIIVIYGYAHMKGTFELLKAKDGSWVKN